MSRIFLDRAAAYRRAEAAPKTKRGPAEPAPAQARVHRHTTAGHASRASAAAGQDPSARSERADELFRQGVALFNGVRYWHAHEAWETLWRAAPDEERDFYQGLIMLAAGLLHLQRRNLRGARNKLAEGVEKLRQVPADASGHLRQRAGRAAERILDDLNAGLLPYLIPPVIRFVEIDRANGTEPMSDDRVEHDSMGEVRVPAGARWGAHDAAGGRELPDQRPALRSGAASRRSAGSRPRPPRSTRELGVLDPRRGRGHPRGRR